MSVSLTALMETLLVRAAAGHPNVHPALQSILHAIKADVTVVVAGRRGAGKTSLVNGLLGTAAEEPGFSTQDRSVMVFTSSNEDVPNWATIVGATSPFLESRRIVELPDRSPGARAELMTSVGRLRPDLLLYVAAAPLRSDEALLISEARGQWGLGLTEIVLVGNPDSAGMETSVFSGQRPGRPEGGRPAVAGQVVTESTLRKSTCPGAERAVTAAMGYVEARRIADALEAVGALAAKEDEPGWSAQVRDDLERVSLSPYAHVLRERSALELALSGDASLEDELLDDLLGFYLPLEPPRPARDGGRTELLRTAAGWRTQANRLPPEAAAVARTVVGSCQLRLRALAPSPADPGGPPAPTGRVLHHVRA